MKIKFFVILGASICSIILSGCSVPEVDTSTIDEVILSQEQETVTETTIETELLQSEETEEIITDMPNNDTAYPITEVVTEELSESIVTEEKTDVDIDLQKLGSTMAYALTDNMIASPQDYVGKTIRVYGQFFATYWQETDKSYYYITVSDELGCCQQAIEFIWDDNTHIWPDEYPEPDSIIEVKGVIRTYEEFDFTYPYIDIDEIICE